MTDNKEAMIIIDTRTSRSGGTVCISTIRYTVNAREDCRSEDHRLAFDAAVALGRDFSLRGLEARHEEPS